MSKVQPRTLSGFMELLPARKIQFDRMAAIIRESFSLYGFTPLDTPLIEASEALLAKGAQLGTVLAFMMAVTTLSLPSMIMLRKAVKPRLLGLFIAICTSGIILIGYLFNVFQFYLISI